MSNAIIGIKIADGSFYPILEEGKPGEKKLEVTTVRDDQTTVQINLYRSESGDMSDADYVDTLLIDNLVPHPKEEPSFGLIVKIDENNVLSAEIDDPETGEKSDTKVSLVKMVNKSIFDEPDYKVTSEEESKDTLDLNESDIDISNFSDDISLKDIDFDLPEESVPSDTTAVTSFSDDFSFEMPDEPEPSAASVDSSLTDDFSFELPDDATIDSSETDFIGLEEDLAPAAGGMADLLKDFSLPDFDDPSESVEESEEENQTTEDYALSEESVIEEPIVEESVTDETEATTAVTAPAEAAESDDFSFAMPDETEPAASTAETSLSDDFSFEMPDETEPAAAVTAPTEAAESDDFSFAMPDETEPAASTAETSLSDDFSFEMPDETEAATAVTAPAEAAESDDFSFAMPDESEPAASTAETSLSDDFSFEMPDEPVSAAVIATNNDEPVIEEPVAESVLTDDDFSFSTDFMDEDNDIDEDEKPFSFDSLPDFDEIPELSNSEASSIDDDLDIDFSIPDTNNKSENKRMYSNYSDNQQEYEFAPSGNMQSALFGDGDLFEETKKQKERKVLVPVIICILCALISLGVLGVVLYLTPSIMKIAGGIQSSDSPAIEKTIPSDVSSKEQKQNIVAEEEIVVEKPTTRFAEENKIVVLEQTVSPVVPENKNTQNQTSGIIRHLVKWGDTLWDLAGFYYRNPWLFKIISDANNLKNPDLIISGTYLTIPER